MKKRTPIIALLAITQAFVFQALAEVFTSPPNSYTATAAGSTVTGLEFTSGANSFTMTSGGSLTVTNTGNNSAQGLIYTSGDGPTIDISGGLFEVNEIQGGEALLMQVYKANTDISISGGTFNLLETGHGTAKGFLLAGNPCTFNISGGTFNVDHWYQAGNTDHGVFLQTLGAAKCTISGGEFNMETGTPFPFDIIHGSSQTMKFECDEYYTSIDPDNPLLIDNDGYVSNTSGIVAGKFADGNEFSFTFTNITTATGKIQLTGTASSAPNVISVPPSITNTAVGATVWGIRMSSDNLTKNTVRVSEGGEIRVTKTGSGTAYGIWSHAIGAENQTIEMTGGLLDVHEENAGNAYGIWLQNENTTLEITNGTVNVFEYGHNEPRTFCAEKSGTSIDISGGTYSVLQHVTETDETDSRKGYLFEMKGGDSSLTLSGGDFTQLNDAPRTNDITPEHGGTLEPPTRHIILSGMRASALIEADTYNAGSLTIDESGVVSNLSGTISGTFADGNTFSFNFERVDGNDTTLQITGTPSSGYASWEGSFGVDIGAESNDFENDGMNNLLEYALGGNPTLDDADDIQPQGQINGTNLYYISKQVKDDDVTITVGTKLNLTGVSNINTNDVSVVGAPGDDGDYLTVTNSTPMTEAVKFIGMEVSK